MKRFISLFYVIGALLFVVVSTEINVDEDDDATLFPPIPRNKSNDTHKYYRHVPPRWLQWILLIGIPVLIALGLIGNSISFVILKEAAKKNTSHFYLTSLTVCDSLTLISIIFSIYSGITLKEYYHAIGKHDNWIRMYMRNNGVIQSRLYVSFVVRTVSVWIIVMFNCERCRAVKNPMTKRPMRRAFISFIIIIIWALLLNIHVLFGYEFSTGEARITVVMEIGVLFTMIFQTLVPWIIVLICNIIIVRHLQGGNNGMQLTEEFKDNMNISKGVTRKLILVSIAFLITTFPLLAITIIRLIVTKLIKVDFDSNVRIWIDGVWNASFLPFTCNFSCNFILYCFTGRKFRLATWYLLTCRWNDMRIVRSKMITQVTQRHKHRKMRPNSSTTSSTRVTYLRESSCGGPSSMQFVRNSSPPDICVEQSMCFKHALLSPALEESEDS